MHMSAVPSFGLLSASPRTARTVLLAGALWLALAPAARADDRRFGDSTWVAPVPVAEDPGDPTSAGPRIDSPDHERTWESVLRAPFRIGFLPVRLIARGLEWGAGFAGERFEPSGQKARVHKPGISAYPVFDTGPGLGGGLTRSGFGGESSQIGLSGVWTWTDRRNARLWHVVGAQEGPVRFTVLGDYNFRPERRFYGLGNSTRVQDRTIFLQETGTAQALLRFGPTFDRQLRLNGGYSSISSRRGYNDGPAAADKFSPSQVPFLLRESRLVFFGGGFDVAVRDDRADPSLGLHGRADVLRYQDVDDSGVRYWQSFVEGRAYVPVFSKRRVIAVRSLYRFVHPDDSSPPIPFYRLPVSKDAARFLSYKSERFRDRHLVTLQAEYRWIVWKRMFALASAQLGEVASTAKRMRIADVHESYGGGLRYALNERAVARLEILHGAEGTGFNLELGGDF
jgi:hypothetical protein